MPPRFDSPDEFHRTVDVLVNAGEIEDGTKIWWDLRPSARYPTIEMRITDMCTRIDDTVAIAALYRCITGCSFDYGCENQRWRDYSDFLINENRWLAQRSGTSRSLIDFGKGTAVPFVDLADELIALVMEDACTSAASPKSSMSVASLLKEPHPTARSPFTTRRLPPERRRKRR